MPIREQYHSEISPNDDWILHWKIFGFSFAMIQYLELSKIDFEFSQEPSNA